MLLFRQLNRVVSKRTCLSLGRSSSLLYSSVSGGTFLPPESVLAIKGYRSKMEDEHLVFEDNECKVLAVFDGHAGNAVSYYMKTHFQQFFLEARNIKMSSVVELKNNDIADILRTAHANIDKDILATYKIAGSTSCMVYIDKSIPHFVVAANVGDSRAVLSRNGEAVDLTEDHKPNLESEKKRIESLGGSVTWTGKVDKDGNPIEKYGAYRVNNILAMSRAMGDGYLRPYVTSEPDFKDLSLTSDDEFIVVATDGLWDVISSQECVSIIRELLAADTAMLPATMLKEDERREFHSKDESTKKHLLKNMIASFMVELALKRTSCDNITILIQWLKSG